MEKRKFAFREVPILESVEENYIKLVGESTNLTNEKFLDALKQELKTFFNTYTPHVEILQRTPKKIIIQTSKFKGSNSTYSDHTLWVFIHYGNGTYEWTLDRYSL